MLSTQEIRQGRHRREPVVGKRVRSSENRLWAIVLFLLPAVVLFGLLVLAPPKG